LVQLSGARGLTYSQAMAQPSTQTELADLEARLAELVGIAQTLLDENKSLRATQEQLSADRANLIAKNEMARARVEAMIHRLKSLEAPH
jgi:cell division protein ZapB